MRIGVVHTVGSVCRCAEALEQGLRALGHEPLLADSESIELRASELAKRCDWVIDHTDTFHGSGLLRATVRLLLEGRGARLVGADARACLLADDKEAAKVRLAARGIPTVPGIAAASPDWRLPAWLRFPAIVKPVFAHMSRGLGLANTEAEARRQVKELLLATGQPVLVEPFVSGREIGVCVLDGTRGPEALPPVEWGLEAGTGVLTAGFKELEFEPDRGNLFPAELPGPLADELSALAVAAFQALGLRDYARFDIRLSPAGTPYFLEANVTPSLELSEALAASARWAGIDYPSLVERLLRSAAARCAAKCEAGNETVSVPLPGGAVELVLPPRVHPPPASSLQLAALLDVRPGERVLDLGCGSGLLSLAAARLGAARVVAVDLDPRSLAATEENARRNGLADRIEVRSGSWYEALDPRSDRFQVIIATPPQTPGPCPFGPRYGGPDGSRHLRTVVEGAPRFLDPERGRLWLLALSLANPSGARELLDVAFDEVTLARQSKRDFSPAEYDGLHPGLFDYLQELRRRGRCVFSVDGEGGFSFQNLYYRAAVPKAACPR